MGLTDPSEIIEKIKGDAEIEFNSKGNAIKRKGMKEVPELT